MTGMDDFSHSPVTVRGPLATTSSRLVTFARIFTHEGRLFVAEGTNRGGKVRSVTEYPAPEGAPVPNPHRSKGYTWGEWDWDSCGCASSWRKHSTEKLVGMAEPSPALAALLEEPVNADDEDGPDAEVVDFPGVASDATDPLQAQG